MAKDSPVVMEGVQIIFRNFAGKEGQYNREGERNFGVLIDTDTAEAMAADGWNVKQLRPREDDEDEMPQAWLPVAVSYTARAPKIVLVTSRGKTRLGQNDIEMLDWADILNVDLIVRPYAWEVQGKTGIKAYLQSLYVTIEEDPLERKYADVDEQGTEES